MTRFHLETLPLPQRALWPHLRPVAALGLVLYGGTAIALRLGHRVSVDFDFFTDLPLDKGALFRQLPLLTKGLILQDGPETLTVLQPADAEGEGQVQLSFFGSIGFGRVGLPEQSPDGVGVLASLEDLLATKLKVLLQRVEAKDYQDVTTLLRCGLSLEAGLAGARALFGPAFQPSECLKALTWFEGGDLDLLSPADRLTLIEASRSVRDLPGRERLSLRLMP